MYLYTQIDSIRGFYLTQSRFRRVLLTLSMNLLEAPAAARPGQRTLNFREGPDPVDTSLLVLPPAAASTTKNSSKNLWNASISTTLQCDRILDDERTGIFLNRDNDDVEVTKKSCPGSSLSLQFRDFVVSGATRLVLQRYYSEYCDL